MGKLLSCAHGFLRCGDKGHRMRDCLAQMIKGREVKQSPHDGQNLGIKKETSFYALQEKKGMGLVPNEGSGKW